mmetsp:Transcript_84204/g.212315  ORF Transcript_84204/g.212315 Transcript_84204/m.212315 type:complete len:173 (-) Transcript_84204:243-761(-)
MWFSLSCDRCCGHEPGSGEISVSKVRQEPVGDEIPNLLGSLPKVAELEKSQKLSLQVEAAGEQPTGEQPAVEQERSQEIPTQAGLKFQVTLFRGDPKTEKIGADINQRKADPAGLKVKLVKEGLLEQWNDDNPERQVQPGDVITSVNGKSDHRGMTEAMFKDPKLTLTVVRC